MSEEQIKQYYERIEKLLNGANKETYGFAPEEIRQILRWYEDLQQRIDKAIEYIRGCCNMDSKFVNLHYDYAQNDMQPEQVDTLLEILKGSE